MVALDLNADSRDGAPCMRRTSTVDRLPLIRVETASDAGMEPGFHPSEHAAIAEIPADMTDEELKIAASL